MRWPESFFAITAASAVAKAHRSLRWITEGSQGETAVTELLQGLPGDYFLLNDVVLPRHPGNIDHVVGAPCGIVVIETKNFSGSVELCASPMPTVKWQSTLSDCVVGQ